MKQVTVTIEGLSVYQQGKAYFADKLPKEINDAYEKRTWRERGHYDENGEAFIPAMAFKYCLATAAAYLMKKIPGAGKASYKKHFVSGILVTEGLPLGVKKDDVAGTWLYIPQPNTGGNRVWKNFPTFHQWGGDVVFYVLNDIITEDVFTEHIEEAGSFIGLGVFRPERGGINGRFKVTNVDWQEMVDAEQAAA